MTAVPTLLSAGGSQTSIDGLWTLRIELIRSPGFTSAGVVASFSPAPCNVAAPAGQRNTTGGESAA